MKKIKTILYLFCSFCFVILVLEIGLRLTGKLKTYSEKNFNTYQSPYAENSNNPIYMENPLDTIDAQQKEFSYTYYLNELGLNDSRDLTKVIQENTYIYLGDSFTYGVGAPQDSSLPAILSQINSCTFINAGFSGSDPFYENKLIDSIFVPKGFNNYIVMLNVSDLYDYIFRGGEERFLKNGSIAYNKAPWIEKIHKYSFIFRAFVHGILKMDYTLLSPNKMKDKKHEAVLAYAELLIEINRHHHLIVVLQPYARQYSNSSHILNEVMQFSYLEDLEKILNEQGLKTINLDNSLRVQLNENNYLDYSWEIDGHYNSKGYLLMAEIIEQELKASYICN